LLFSEDIRQEVSREQETEETGEDAENSKGECSMTKYDELVCFFQKWMSGPVGGGTLGDAWAILLADIVCGFKAYNDLLPEERLKVRVFLVQHIASIQDIVPKFDFSRTTSPLG
jgi:hypothetical protein